MDKSVVGAERCLMPEPIHEAIMMDNRRFDGATCAIVMVALMLTSLNFRVAGAATLEEVARCRAIEPIREKLSCFNSLKHGHHSKLNSDTRTKIEEPTAPKPEGEASMQTRNGDAFTAGDTIPSNAKRQPSATPPHAVTPVVGAFVTPQQGAPAVTQAPAEKSQQVVPVDTTPSTTVKIDQDSSAPTNKSTATQPERATSVQGSPPQAEPPATTKMEHQDSPDGEKPLARTNQSAPKDDPTTTGSIDRVNLVGRPLCVDPDALLAMLNAGLLTSNPQEAATEGCRLIPDDAELTRLERYPSVFPIVHITRVKVMSRTHPELTTGFTIETER
jgi:hypothetical protein